MTQIEARRPNLALLCALLTRGRERGTTPFPNLEILNPDNSECGALNPRVELHYSCMRCLAVCCFVVRARPSLVGVLGGGGAAGTAHSLHLPRPSPNPTRRSRTKPNKVQPFSRLIGAPQTNYMPTACIFTCHREEGDASIPPRQIDKDTDRHRPARQKCLHAHQVFYGHMYPPSRRRLPRVASIQGRNGELRHKPTRHKDLVCLFIPPNPPPRLSRAKPSQTIPF